MLNYRKNMKEQKILDLDDKEEAKRKMEEYLIWECPRYLDSKLASVELIHDISINLFEGKEKSRVLVYDVKLQNRTEAFGTIGGILYPHHPPYSNLFKKTKVKDANTAASMHLYLEAVIRYGQTSTFKNPEDLRGLVELLKIPKGLRYF